MALAIDSVYSSHVSAGVEVARVNAMSELVSGLLVTYLPHLVAALQSDQELTDLLQRLDRKLDTILGDDDQKEAEKRGDKYDGDVPYVNKEKDTEKRRKYMGREPFAHAESQKDEKKRYYDGNIPYVYEDERTVDDGKTYDHEDEPLTETEKQKEENVLRQMLELLVRKRDHDIPFPLVGYKRDQQ